MNAAAPPGEWLPLLQRLLACLRRSRETPLQFEIDSAGIAAAVLADFSPERAKDAKRVVGALSALIDECMRGDASGDVDCDRAAASSLVEWIDRFYRAMRSVHSAAIDILALRVEGFEARDIADRLNLGLRQVHSILREMRASWCGDFGG